MRDDEEAARRRMKKEEERKDGINIQEMEAEMDKLRLLIQQEKEKLR